MLIGLCFFSTLLLEILLLLIAFFSLVKNTESVILVFVCMGQNLAAEPFSAIQKVCLQNCFTSYPWGGGGIPYKPVSGYQFSA